MKALARKKKRGRPIKEGVARTDSGRISRARNPGEAPDKLAKDVRMRMHGVTKEQAGQPEAATVIGRLSLLGQSAGGISYDQYQALTEYRELRERYMRVIGAPDSLVANNGGGMGDDEGEAEIVVKARLDKADAAIASCQIENRTSNIYAALSLLVFRDEIHSHMIGDLRLVSNALHRHFFQGLHNSRKSGNYGRK